MIVTFQKAIAMDPEGAARLVAKSPHHYESMMVWCNALGAIYDTEDGCLKIRYLDESGSYSMHSFTDMSNTRIAALMAKDPSRVLIHGFVKGVLGNRVYNECRMEIC